MRTRLMIAIFAGILSFGTLSSQDIGFGPVLGFQRAADADEGRMMYGAALRMKLSPAFALEGSLHYRQERYVDGLFTVRSWPVMASALIYPFPNVYGTFGGGWYNTTFDFDAPLGNTTEQEFGWHLGGGVEVPLSDTVNLTGDIRYVFLDYDVEELVEVDNISSNFYVLSVGLLFGL